MLYVDVFARVLQALQAQDWQGKRMKKLEVAGFRCFGCLVAPGAACEYPISRDSQRGISPAHLSPLSPTVQSPD
jgi:hypothetical protein